MPRVRYLRIGFTNPIYADEVPKFRAAVIEKTGRASDRYHNHTGEDGYLYRYPLIQYKVTGKKASIVCLNEGADQIHFLLGQPDLQLRIGQRVEPFTLEDVQMQQFEVRTWDRSFSYGIKNWLPLNQKNHQEFEAMEGDEAAQIAMLGRLLCGHILGFASGIGWQVPERLQVHIDGIREMKLLPFKGQHLLAITLDFTANVSLPDHIGLGKGSSVGFGTVKRKYPSKEKTSPQDERE